ncbi:acyl-CoA dehydrogenase family protein [Aquabacterium sp. CECT 9606]|uniref:acyl-CoA dehydrogenase family protein n=1 Tax=Aquabacterium sp. CECT 9606 TaxID=2845822 RepID=UPI001E31BB93|nr:acyl-CoA dehydrogenase family protein [Aquabacterium sp. CECT 9606]CAH0352847.1 Acyl-CoA dehydrogenase [Aquabacterium sp. CECT 9606]
MHFQLTDEQKMIQELARTFADREIIPLAAKADRDEQFPIAVQAKALELGLLNLALPTEYGGGGLGAMEVALVTEQLCRGCLGIGAALSISALASEPILIAGTPAQQQAYFSRLAAGQFASFALTEPAAGSDVAALRTQAKRVDGGYKLTGSKIWISNASLASFMVVFAKTDMDAGHKGISAFVVEREAPGLSVGEPLGKLGQRAAPVCEVFFDEVHVPESSRLGQEGEGFSIAMRTFDRSRPMAAAFALGVMQRCLDEALAYAKERRSMGKAILEHQAVGHKLAEMSMKLEAARLLTYQAAWRADQGQPNTAECAMAKAFACDAAMWAATEAIQVYGGMGYSTEFPVEKLFRDAKVLQIYEGTSEIQRNIILRELTRA